MNSILELLGKNKKELFAFFNENKTLYQKKRKDLIIFAANLLDDDFIITIGTMGNIVSHISLQYADPENLNLATFNDLITKYKEFLNKKFGNPYSDNSNHTTDETVISYFNEDIFASIVAPKFYNTECNYQFYLQFNHQKLAGNLGVYDKKLKLKIYSLYLIGGLVWGLLMFLTCSYDDYSLTNFGIWMGGGVMFSLIFGFFFELFGNRFLTVKPKKVKPKEYQKIIDGEKDLKFDASFLGQLLVSKRNSHLINSKEYPAKMYLTNEKLVIRYLKKGKIIEISTTYIELDKYSLLCFDTDDKHYYFNLNGREENETICNYIDEKLGYKGKEFQKIKEVIEKAFKEYNLYSSYDSTDEPFTYEIYTITKMFFKNNDLSIEELKKELIMLLEDDSEQVGTDLSTLVYQAVNQYFNNDGR